MTILRRRFHRVLPCLAAALLLCAQSTRAQPLAAAVDAIMQPFSPDGPGAAVIVVKHGQVLLRSAYGLANLETRTPMRPDMVFEIGSVTKQLTSTAILMLVEEHKLSLDDDIRKYLPEFPDKGVPITIEHLLTHTSGIKDYTSDPKWPSLWRQDLTPAQVVDLVKDAPLDFAPGSRWSYDNTGYTLLGMILEKVSGTTYADFIERRILQPLGLTHTRYGSATTVIPQRAAGYTKGKDGWENAPYLSMAQPYAAGALMSNVDDLARWDAAVAAGKLISPALWARAFADHHLPDGHDTRYGYGWQLGGLDGHPLLHHSGGIPGYSCEVMRLPDDDVYVAVLTNTDTPPIDADDAAARIAEAALNRVHQDPPPIAMSDDALNRYAGVYEISGGDTRTIVRRGSQLFMVRTGGSEKPIYPSASNQFFVKDSFQVLTFHTNASGSVNEVESRFLDGTPDIGIRRPEGGGR
jgi:CubicO group peptidase (beta-lactamase class C family)